MQRALITAAAILSMTGAAGAVDDWRGTVNVRSAYDYLPDPSAPELNVNIDLVYDRPGAKGKAFGTVSYQRRAQSSFGMLDIYAHALCVGKFNSGNNYSIAATVSKVVGAGVTQKYITFQFDVLNGTSANAVYTNTEADARATCNGPQVGPFNGQFNHGYGIFK